jgi:Flp pilus assembly protein TadG
MRPTSFSRRALRARPRTMLARWRRDRRGATALEFAFIAAPFFLLLLGIMTVGLQFFTILSLETGVSTAARKIRTGEAQKQGLTLADFRQLLCNAAGSYIKCNSKLVIHVKSGAAFADLDPPVSCTTNGTLTPSAGQSTDPLATYSGAQSAAVLVTACYEWDAGGAMWQGIWNMLTVGPGGGGSPKSAGKIVIQATTAFRSEPYQ